MEISIIFKIALVGILVTILNQILKQSGRDEQAFIIYSESQQIVGNGFSIYG